MSRNSYEPTVNVWARGESLSSAIIVLVLANRPNHVFLFEVYDNEAALAAHRETPHFKKYKATTGSLVADRNVRAMLLRF
jgi:quinol monooxygenase YgiN